MYKIDPVPFSFLFLLLHSTHSLSLVPPFPSFPGSTNNSRAPTSPGWDHIPRDVKAMVGQYAFFNCQNRLPHNRTFWLLEGRKDIFSTTYASRASIHNKGRMLRFGPLQEGDDMISINCEVLTQYGLLPSPLGMIYVQSKRIFTMYACM